MKNFILIAMGGSPPPTDGAHSRGAHTPRSTPPAESVSSHREWRRKLRREEIGLHAFAYAALTAHDVNHLPRRVLGGKTACHAFCSQASHAILTAGARQEVTEELITMAGVILNDTAAKEKKPAMVWRIAVKEWLVEHDFIRLKQKVSPISQAQNGPLSR